MKSLFIISSIILFSYLTHAQNRLNKIPELSHYSKLEAETAEELRNLKKNIFESQSNWDNVEKKLAAIISQAPDDYRYSFNEDSITYIKFWDSDEYSKYIEVMQPNNKIVGLQSAYPYACYLMAVIQIERNNFNQAAEALKIGLKLEPKNPYLLNEMGLLFCQMGHQQHDTTLLKQAFNVYYTAIESRPYNTKSNVAASMRGIGYTLIELGDYETAKQFYEESLIYEENKVAHNELAIIENKLKANNTNIHNAGSNLKNTYDINSYEYLTAQKKKLPQEIQDIIPSKYIYIRSKAALFLSSNIDEYRENDYFKYPLKEWDIEQLISGSEQIVHFFKGVSEKYYLSLNSLEDAKNLLLTFHYSMTKNKTFKSTDRESITEAIFKHKMDDSQITLYFKFKK